MRIDILTIFPGMFGDFFGYSIIKKALEKHIATVHLVDFREYASGKHRQVDDYAYGGGAGMVMMVEPISRCIEDLCAQRTYDEIIYMSPDGELFDQKKANFYSTLTNVMILCGHYKGIDERIRELYITRELSIGDYVISGGELAAAVFCDSIIRLIPGAMNDETSALSDSFQDDLLSPPVYTRPYDFRGHRVPDILLSGNDKAINEWKHEQSLERTRNKRPQLLENQDQDIQNTDHESEK
ncbi:MAG: tRNA (guanosine(37)-N1)-methyltransferase TrmD [Bacteroidales bacterium]|nr:tRNA (guanosine(37)-N1)-methyltransferase TrmD [Bacteroidales bacterium]